MYLDPGIGSMIIQIIVASLATVGAALIVMRNKLSVWFKKGPKSADASEGDVAEAVVQDDAEQEQKETEK